MSRGRRRPPGAGGCVTKVEKPGRSRETTHSHLPRVFNAQPCQTWQRALNGQAHKLEDTGGLQCPHRWTPGWPGGGEGKESCASCPGETVGPSNLQWRLESSRSSVSSRIGRVRVGDREGEIRDQVTLGLMNFQSVPGLGHGLRWPRLHPGRVSAAHSAPPRRHTLWVTSPSASAGRLPADSPGRTPGYPTLTRGALHTPQNLHRGSPANRPATGFSLRGLPVLASVTPTGGPSHSITAGRAEARSLR